MAQCAMDTNGNLKDASEIDWYHDQDDANPIPRQPPGETSGCRPQRNAILTEKLRDPNNMEKPGLTSHKRAVEQYRATQTKASTASGSSISVQTTSPKQSPLPPVPTKERTDDAAGAQTSLDPPLLSGIRAATKRWISSVLVPSEGDGDIGETIHDEHERQAEKKGVVFKLLLSNRLACLFGN